jgi:hypothetical protein
VMGVKAEKDKPTSSYVTGRDGTTYQDLQNLVDQAHREAIMGISASPLRSSPRSPRRIFTSADRGRFLRLPPAQRPSRPVRLPEGGPCS